MRRVKIVKFLTVSVVSILLAAMVGCQAKVRPVEPVDARELVGVARRLLTTDAKPEELSKSLPSRLTAGRTSNAVFVTLHRITPGNPLRAGDRTDSIFASLVSAVEKIKADKRFIENAADKMDSMTIQVDIMSDEPVEVERSGEGKKAELIYEVGIDGLLAERHIKGRETPDRSLYFLPEDFYYRDLGSNAENKVRKKIESYLITKIGVFIPGQTVLLKYKKFHTVAAAEEVPGGEAHVLYRANVPLPKGEPGVQLADAYRRGADWLVSSVMDNGVFRYEYRPLFGKMKRKYQSTDHALAVEVLYDAYKETGNKSYLDAANATVQFLKDNIEIYDVHLNLAGFELGDKSSLGVNAATLRALLNIPEEFKTLRDRTMAASLANLLEAMQDEDGRFYTYYYQVRERKMPEGQARNYVGQALVALMKMYRYNGDKRWLAAAEKGYAKVLADTGDDRILNGWSLMAGAMLAEIDGKEQYRDRVFAEADALVKQQFDENAPYPDYAGGFNNVTPPQTDSTAIRANMLSAAYSLALKVGDSIRSERYADALVKAAWFIAGQQYRTENSYYLVKPEEALGGFRENMISDRLRIDYTANSMTAIAGALDVIAQRENKRFLKSGPTAVTEPE